MQYDPKIESETSVQIISHQLESLLNWRLEIASLTEKEYYCASEMKEQTVEQTTGRITAIWRGHAVLGAEFTVTVGWEMLENELCSGHLSYSGYEYQCPVETIHFPIVEAQLEPDAGYLASHFDMGLILRGEEFLGPDAVYQADYTAMQFSALLNPSGRNYYFDHRDSDNYIKSYQTRISNDAKTLTYAGIHYPPVVDNLENYTIPYANTCGMFRGGWFEAGQIYREWALRQTWHQNRVGVTNPLRDISLWVWNRGLIDDVIPPMKKLAKECGVPVALDWYWWHHNPYDTAYPDFWPPREGEEAFENAVADLSSHNIFTQVYINGSTWDMDSDGWQNGGTESATVDEQGNVRNHAFNKFNKHRLAFMCGEAPEFHNRLSALTRKIREAGLHGLYLDMIGGMRGGYRCYNPAHSHQPGGGNYAVAGYRAMLNRLKQENPDFPLTTEYANEAYMDITDGGIVCASISQERMKVSGDVVPLFTSVYHGHFALFGNMAIPHGIPAWDPLWPSEDRWKEEKPWHRLFPDQFFLEMARGPVWGVQPMVCNLTESIFEDPEFSEQCRFIIDTARFYHANREFLFDGDMLSPDGFVCAKHEVEFMARGTFTMEHEYQIIRKKHPVIFHSFWQSNSGARALFMVNYTGTEQQWRYQELNGVLPARSWQRIDLECGI